MAARSPTSYTQYIDDSGFVARQSVTTTQPSNVFDDQVFIFEKQEMVVSDVFYPIYRSSPAVWTSLGPKFFVQNPNKDAATYNAEFSILCWGDNAITDFSVAIYHVGRAVRHSYTVNANRTSHLWRAWTACVLYGDSSENELRIDVGVAEGTQGVYVAGVAICTNW